MLKKPAHDRCKHTEIMKPAKLLQKQNNVLLEQPKIKSV